MVEVTSLLRDFNAEIGKRKDKHIVGNHGVGTRNEREEEFVQFCKEIQFAITNTRFNLPLTRLYSLRAPGDTTNM